MTGNSRSQAPAPLDFRTSVNGGLGDFDIGSWLDALLALPRSATLLDLGAGTGNLLTAYARHIRPPGRCVAMDISEASLAALAQKCTAFGMPVEVVCADIDSLLEADRHPDLAELSHISAVYSLYYSASPRSLVRALIRRLANNGALLVVGPMPGNNKEWYDLLTDAGVGLDDALMAVSEKFMLQDVLPGMEAALQVDQHTAVNQVVFTNLEDLERYWRSCVYHDPTKDEAVRASLESYFTRRDSFVMLKRIGAFVGRAR